MFIAMVAKTISQCIPKSNSMFRVTRFVAFCGRFRKA